MSDPLAPPIQAQTLLDLQRRRRYEAAEELFNSWSKEEQVAVVLAAPAETRPGLLFLAEDASPLVERLSPQAFRAVQAAADDVDTITLMGLATPAQLQFQLDLDCGEPEDPDEQAITDLWELWCACDDTLFATLEGLDPDLLAVHLLPVVTWKQDLDDLLTHRQCGEGWYFTPDDLRCEDSWGRQVLERLHAHAPELFQAVCERLLGIEDDPDEPEDPDAPALEPEEARARLIARATRHRTARLAALGLEAEEQFNDLLRIVPIPDSPAPIGQNLAGPPMPVLPAALTFLATDPHIDESACDRLRKRLAGLQHRLALALWKFEDRDAIDPPDLGQTLACLLGLGLERLAGADPSAAARVLLAQDPTAILRLGWTLLTQLRQRATALRADPAIPCRLIDRQPVLDLSLQAQSRLDNASRLPPRDVDDQPLATLVGLWQLDHDLDAVDAELRAVTDGWPLSLSAILSTPGIQPDGTGIISTAMVAAANLENALRGRPPATWHIYTLAERRQAARHLDAATQSQALTCLDATLVATGWDARRRSLLAPVLEAGWRILVEDAPRIDSNLIQGFVRL